MMMSESEFTELKNLQNKISPMSSNSKMSFNSDSDKHISQKSTSTENMNKPRVYLETSFISYLTGPLSQNLITAANQYVTREWWENRRLAFDLFISQSVMDEIRQGNPTESAKRLAMVKDITSLVSTQEVVDGLSWWATINLLPILRWLLRWKSLIESFSAATRKTCTVSPST
jgi:hypothetical protein